MSSVTNLNSLNLLTLSNRYCQSSSANVNSNGDKGQPCLVPRFRSNGGECKTFVRTAACGALHIISIHLTEL